MHSGVQEEFRRFEEQFGRRPKAVAYCRVSTTEESQLNSLENQRSYFERELKEDPSDVIKIYPERGITGTKLNRPEFTKMIKDAGLDVIEIKDKDSGRKTGEAYTVSKRKPKFDYIIVKNTSRFARNMEVMSIINRLREKDVFVYFLNINKSTRLSDDLPFIQIFLTFDENESRDRSQKVRFGREEGAKKGKIYASGQLYGYRYVKETNSLEIVEEEAAAIRRMFELYSQGFGCRRIANTLNEEGYRKRPSNLPNSTKRTEWVSSDITKKITNEKYKGFNNPQKHTRGYVFENKPNYMRTREHYICEPSDRIPAIVDPVIFDKCQQVREAHTKYVNNKKGIAYCGVTKYAEKIRCAKCGAFFHSQKNKQGERYYLCSTKHTYGIKKCHSKNITEKYIDDELKMFEDGKVINADIEHAKQEIYERLIVFIVAAIEMNIEEDALEAVRPINERLTQVNIMLDNAAETLLLTNSRDMVDKVEALGQEKEVLTKQKDAILKNNSNLYDYVQDLLDEYNKAVEDLLPRDSYSPEEILNMLEYVVFDDKKLVDFKLNIFAKLEALLFEKINPDGFSSITGYNADIENTFTTYITKLKGLVKADKKIAKAQKQ